MALSTLDILKSCDISPFILRLPQQLSRPDYVSVAKVCEAHGGKWNKTAKAIVFDAGTAALRAAIDAGKYTDPKKDLSFFPTPADLAARVCRAAGLESHHLLLEPSAGMGDLIASAHGLVRWIDLVEINPANCEALRHRRADGGPQSRYTVLEADFLTLAPEPIYDRIVMNPPFSGPGNRDLDAVHILHAWRFLRPGGRLVAIASAGLTFRDNGSAALCRYVIESHGGGIERLPASSFKESGTEVETCLVELDKPGP